MKVRVKDFQRLKGEHTFEFPEGLTIIQGKSGSGKSTVFYAVEDCLSNPSGVADTINWDAKSCEVSIENNGNSVTWIKTNTSSEYVDQDGKSYVKASKIDSRDLADLGFYFDKKDDIVNIHSEWKKLFPFEASDTEMFKLFEDIFNISSSFQIVDCIKKDEQEKKGLSNTISSQINDLTIRNNNISSILERINPDVDSFIQDLTCKEQVINSIKADFDVLSKNQAYKELNIPSVFDASKLVDTYSQIQDDYILYQKNKKLSEINIPEIKSFEISENPYIEDYTTYKTTLDVIKQYDVALASIEQEEQAVRDKLKNIKVCPTCGRPLEEGICC